jgi:Animal haem peroxidase
LRTPRLNLECVYGTGPVGHPFLYDWESPTSPGVKLLVGHQAGTGELAADDLPRNQQGRALVGDPRNDENLIIAQLHLLLIRFHNAVVDHLHDREHLSVAELLSESRRIVRCHYQWIVTHDFLRRLAGRATAESVLETGADGAPHKVLRKHYRWDEEPFIPVEFSGAAYRFGHSMVRKDYGINDLVGRAVPIFPTVGQTNNLTGFRPLPRALEIDWRRFFELGDENDPLRPQHSLRIDTAIVPALCDVPLVVVPDVANPDHENRCALPWLDLRRGGALGVPSGQNVARAMGLAPLTEAQLRLEAIEEQDARAALLTATPLWYHILCEAATTEFGDSGRHLGPVGGRIVAEVLVGLVEGDRGSYISQDPAWTPELPRAMADDFTMADLVCFSLGHEASRPL